MQAEAKAAIAEKPGGSFFLWGAYGSGKTHLLYAQFRLMASSYDVRPMVRTTREIVQELTRAELERDRYVSPLLDALHGSVRLHLFWDDADKLKVTDFKFEVLFDLVDTIYRRNLGLTMTSNLPLDAADHRDLQEKLDPAIARRIPEICRVLEF